MFRLLFQGPKETKVEWIDSDNLQHLREQRATMLAWADNNNTRYMLEPFICYIGKDGWIRKTDGTYHHIEEK